MSAPALPTNEESVEPKQEHQEEEGFPEKGPSNYEKTDSDVLLLSYPVAFTWNDKSKQGDNEPEQDETFVPTMPKNEQEEELKRKETYTPARSKETVEATFVREAGSLLNLFQALKTKTNICADLLQGVQQAVITAKQLYMEDPDRIRVTDLVAKTRGDETKLGGAVDGTGYWLERKLKTD
ncbi:hypothetical protein PI125_g20291 [Phytophthora idaei]|nr:hypothetical protein PI125_g20291 [Phytophthora idaei]KAG3128304.1 hypothetical protein PI126_g21464 [Phytophthora idaei]